MYEHLALNRVGLPVYDNFSKDIYTHEELKKIIFNSPLSPKPVVRDLTYTWGWKEFITPHLSTPQLESHTKYNSFVLTYENEKGVLR